MNANDPVINATVVFINLTPAIDENVPITIIIMASKY